MILLLLQFLNTNLPLSVFQQVTQAALASAVHNRHILILVILMQSVVLLLECAHHSICLGQVPQMVTSLLHELIF